MPYTYLQSIKDNIQKFTFIELRELNDFIQLKLDSKGDILKEVKDLKEMGHTLNAIKLLRDSGLSRGSLVEDKHYVESL